MEVSYERTGTAIIIHVEGVPSDPGFLPAVIGLLETGEKRLIVNLRVLRFDSNCLGEATVCHLKAKRKGAILSMVSSDERVWKLIESLKLDRILDFYRTEKDALAAFPPEDDLTR